MDPRDQFCPHRLSHLKQKVSDTCPLPPGHTGNRAAVCTIAQGVSENIPCPKITMNRHSLTRSSHQRKIHSYPTPPHALVTRPKTSDQAAVAEALATRTAADGGQKTADEETASATTTATCVANTTPAGSVGSGGTGPTAKSTGAVLVSASISAVAVSSFCCANSRCRNFLKGVGAAGSADLVLVSKQHETMLVFLFFPGTIVFVALDPIVESHFLHGWFVMVPFQLNAVRGNVADKSEQWDQATRALKYWYRV